MAYRRSIVTRATLLTRRLSLSPLSNYSSDNDKNKRRQDPPPLFPFAAVSPPSSFFPNPSFYYPFASGRSLSTDSGAEKADECFADVADVLSGSGDVVGPVLGEVAAAAADSAFPVAALQYLIEGVHNFTGFSCISLKVYTILWGLIGTISIPVLAVHVRL